MTPEERRAVLEEAHDPVRRASLRAGAEATRAWDAAHPRSFGEYLDFLSEFWTLFGPVPARDDRISGEGLRL
jgi:hypothetical protein